MSNYLNNQSSSSRNNPNFQSLVVTGSTTLNKLKTNNDCLYCSGTSSSTTGIAANAIGGSTTKQVGTSISYNSISGTVNFVLGNEGNYLLTYFVNWPANPTGQRSSRIIFSSGFASIHSGNSQVDACSAGPTWTNGSALMYYDGIANSDLALSLFQNSGGTLAPEFTINVIKLS